MIVMKFGGTSVEDARAIERVAAIVRDRLPQRPVVVVSAMAKVTDTLLAMARAAGAGERKTALKLCRSLQERHYNTASELLASKIVAAAFSALGLKAAHVDSREVLVTDSSFMEAIPQIEETNEHLQNKVQPLLEAGRVPVMGGFIGANPAGITTTIGG